MEKWEYYVILFKILIVFFKQNSVQLHLEIFKLDTVEYKPFLVNLTLNNCFILAKTVTSFYTTFLMNQLKNYTNFDFNKKCPILPVSYFFANIFLIMQSLSFLANDIFQEFRSGRKSTSKFTNSVWQVQNFTWALLTRQWSNGKVVWN